MNTVILEHELAPGRVLQLAQGDLSEERVDAIVNAANAHLQHGGGVAGAIARRGGAQIQADSDAWVRQHGPVTHAEPALTGGGNLPCRFVIHAVGPVWGEGNEQARLAQTIAGALQKAEQLGLQSIALPAISTGIFGFPRQLAAEVVLEAILNHFASQPASTLRQVRLVFIDLPTLQAFTQAWEKRSLGAPGDHQAGT
ncbi:MAG: macro domain-containing protein [Anaerolineales bacterium]|nr:macro domain-containing protein [Anaerolineales bacterium]